MMVETTSWSIDDYLTTEEAMVGYLNAVIEEEDPKLLQAALGDIARARGMTEVAHSAGVGRESLYKSLKDTGSPSFATIFKVSGALGLQLQFAVRPPTTT
jgi:probable addiction module antidote protein